MKKVFVYGAAALLIGAGLLFVLSGCEQPDGGTSGGAPGIPICASVEAVEAYLETAPGGTDDNPVSLTVELSLADDWAGLLSAIQGAEKYVSLDLSACAMTGEFDPGAASTGEGWIVSLILPDGATGIKAGERKNGTFKRFTALKSVSGSGITSAGDYAFFRCDTLTSVSFPQAASIGESAFIDCDALASVDLPEATDIGKSAFADCDALISVSLPAAASIGESAFSGCDALTGVNFPEAASVGFAAFSTCLVLTSVSLPKAATIGKSALSHCAALEAVNLPKAVSIGDYALNYCAALTSVSLPAAASIGKYAFAACESLNTVRLGSAAPTLETDMFYGNTLVDQPLTVKVPSGADGYGATPVNTTDANWGNGFRGGGWDGSALSDSRKVNRLIKLTIQYGN